jgi:hypothetical protein
MTRTPLNLTCDVEQGHVRALARCKSLCSLVALQPQGEDE